MNLQFFELLALFSMSFVMCIFMIIGFALGAYVVFRTKREGHEPMFNVREQKGDAGQVPEDYGSFENTMTPWSPWDGRSQIYDDGSEPPEGGDVDKILYGQNQRGQKFQEDFQKQVMKE